MKKIICRNPFFIRSVFVLLLRDVPEGVDMSQSLFHQVCVRSEGGAKDEPGTIESQSLFHQVCVRSTNTGEVLCGKMTSQSLFHQVCVRSP